MHLGTVHSKMKSEDTAACQEVKFDDISATCNLPLQSAGTFCYPL